MSESPDDRVLSLRAAWRELPADGRGRAAMELAEAMSDSLEFLLEPFAKAVNFRPSTLRRAPLERRARLVREALPRLSPALRRTALRALHIERRADLLRSVIEAVGLPHEEGMPRAGTLPEPFDPEVSVAQVAALEAHWPDDDLRFCLRVLAATLPADWGEVLTDLADRLVRMAEDEGLEPGEDDADALVDSAADDVGLPEGSLQELEFTTLDRILIRTIVSALNRVEGALGWDALDDLVQEVVELNDSRGKSYFHRGFLDSLTREPLAEMGPGDNHARRAWYVSGYLHGVLRLGSDGEVTEKLLALSARDREYLVARGSDGGAMLAPVVIGPLLRAGQLHEAAEFLEAHGQRQPVPLLRAVVQWSSTALAASRVPPGTSVVLGKAVALCDRLMGSEREVPREIHRDLARRHASALRRDGQATQAAAILDRLLADASTAVERARLSAWRGLVAAGVRSLEHFSLPVQGAPREEFLQGVERARPFFARGIDVEASSPISLYALSLRAVSEKNVDATEAAEWLRRAIESMDATREPVWEASGLLARARLYLALLDLRSGDDGAAGSAVDRLLAALEEGTDAPVDLVLEGVADAAILDVAGAEEIACHALQRYGYQALSRLDLASIGARSEAFRRALVALLEDDDCGLKVSERWSAWEALLGGSLASVPRDLRLAAEALDAMEKLAEGHGCDQQFLTLLDGDDWDPVWERADRDEAVIRLHLNAGRRAEAGALLFRLVQDAITAGRLRDAEDLIQMVRQELGEVEGFEALKRRLSAVRGDEEPAPITPACPRQPLSILFVGGNETQQAYFRRLEADFSASHPNVTITFEATGWSSNWGRDLEVLERKVSESDAVVIMRFVRTNLGCALRKRASEDGKPWIACTGHGLQSLRLAIGEAIEVASRRTAA